MMNERVWLIHGNNIDHYLELGSVDAIITDPPYGAEVHSKQRVGRNRHGYVDSAPIGFDQLTSEDTELLSHFACTRCKGWSLIFHQDEHLSTWREAMETTTGHGTKFFRPMIWVKTNAKPNLNGDGPGKGHEMIAAFWSDTSRRTKWNGGGKVGVFMHARPHTSNTLSIHRHPTEKPVALMKELIRLFTNPGDVVFDPFMGSGSTGVAALELGRKFIGIEKNIDYYDAATDRINEALSKNELLPTASSKMPTLFGGAAYGSTGTRKRLAREAKENAERS